MHPYGDALYAKQMQALPARGAFGAAAPIGAAARVWALTGRRGPPPAPERADRSGRAGGGIKRPGRVFCGTFPGKTVDKSPLRL